MSQLLTTTPISLTFNRQRGKFALTVNEQHLEQNVCEFLQTISYLVGKDVEEHLMNTDHSFDYVRLPITATGIVLTLDLKEFIAVREAYRYQLYLLKLEDLLMRKAVQFSPFF